MWWDEITLYSISIDISTKYLSRELAALGGLSQLEQLDILGNRNVSLAAVSNTKLYCSVLYSISK